MELIQVKDCIEKLIGEIGKTRREIEDKGNARAKAIANYDMRMGIALATLRDESKYPITILERIAKKVCAPDREALEIAESGYRACLSNLTALMAQLNAYQSIYRHLDET